jgi:hypothetical protein
MPNWVTHRLNLAGPPGELARFVERHIQLSPRPVGVLADTVRRWLTQTGATYEVGAATGPTAAERYRFVTTQSDNALEAIIEVDDAKGQIRLSLQQALTLAPGATAGVAALLNTINGSIGLGRFALNARDGSGEPVSPQEGVRSRRINSPHCSSKAVFIPGSMLTWCAAWRLKRSRH